MPTFINTRPVKRATALTHDLQNMGVEVIELPLLALQPLALLDADNQNIRQLAQGQYDVLVVVSPTAAEIGCQAFAKIANQSPYPSPHQSTHQSPYQALQAEQLSERLTIIAVGLATAKKLAEFGVSAIVPPVANNESMLAMSGICQLSKENRVMIWRGQGGRALLIDSLREAGVQVDVLEFYQRCLPPQTQSIYQHWLHTQSLNQRPHPLAQVLISSGEAFIHWQTIVNATDPRISLHAFHYLALGERLARILETENLTYQRIDNLASATIFNRLTR